MNFENVDVYSGVTLVDRTQKGGTEFIFDGIRFKFEPGQTEMIVPKFVAKWLLTREHTRIWTTEGDFALRFGVKGTPKDVKELEDACGPEVSDLSPIEPRTGMLEGSAVAELDAEKLQVRPTNTPRTDLLDRQGSGGRASFGLER